MYTESDAQQQDLKKRQQISDTVAYFYCGGTILPTFCCSSIRNKCFIYLFPGRKRFAVPREDDPTPPTPVRLFPRNKTSGEVPPPAEQQPTVESGEEQDIDVRACTFCLQTPCISLSAFKPMGRGAARITNHTKRRNNYKWFWRTLKDCGLWENPTYLARKQDLGCMIDDVREVMPHCVIKDVRNRWPNPPHVPYQGHRRS